MVRRPTGFWEKDTITPIPRRFARYAHGWTYETNPLGSTPDDPDWAKMALDGKATTYRLYFNVVNERTDQWLAVNEAKKKQRLLE